MPSIMYKNLFYILLTLLQHFTRFLLRASQTSGCQELGPRSLLSPAPLTLPAWQTANPLLKPQGGTPDPLSFFTFECTGFLIASAMVTQEPGPEVTQLTTSVPDLLLHTTPRGEGSTWRPGVGPGRSKGIQTGL